MFFDKKQLGRNKMNPLYSSLEVIWKNPKLVFLNQKKLEEISSKIAAQELKIPNWRAPVCYPHDDKNFIQFLGIVNSINFAFRDFGTKRKFKIYDWRIKTRPWTGAFAMIGCLLRACEQGFEILNAEFLKRITLTEMKYIFRPVPDHPLPMIAQRKKILNEIGEVLLRKYNGSFCNLFQKAEFNAFGPQGIVTQLTKYFPSFNDCLYYQTTYSWLYFYKRAQLMVMMYHGRASDSQGKLPLIKDIQNLGAIADYQIPRVLEHLGILEYIPALKKVIAKQKIILPGSTAEVAIRAMTILAMKLILEKVNNIRKEKINMCHLDFKLWDMVKKIRIDLPHHLTPTIFY